MPRKILIADDDRDIVNLLALSLQRAGYEVLIAAHAADAIHLARQSRPDLFILDVNMPAGGGLALQQQIRNVAPPSPACFIYLTGDKSDQLLAAAQTSGAFRVLYKPVDTPQLLQTIRAALDQSTIETPGAA